MGIGANFARGRLVVGAGLGGWEGAEPALGGGESAANAVRLAAVDLCWRDWQRWSNRQERKMTLGGFVGTVDLEGDLRPFVPLLRTAEVLHVGKGATFGLGHLEAAAL